MERCSSACLLLMSALLLFADQVHALAGNRKAIAIVDGVALSTKPGHPTGQSASSNYASRYANRGYTPAGATGPTTGASQPVAPRACRAGTVLRVEFSPSVSGDGRIYGSVFGTGIHLVAKQDRFEYEIMWKDPECNCSVEFETGSTYRLRDDGPLDDLGYSPHSEKNVNMSAVAYGKWYKRSWQLASELEGRYIDKFVFSAFATPGTTVTAFFKYIRVARNGEWKKVIFDEGSDPLQVNTYFPGTIVTSCQHLTLLEAGSVHLAAPTVTSHKSDLVLIPGASSVLRGQITSRELTEQSTDLAANASCPWLHPLEELRQLRLAQMSNTNVALLRVQVVIRHAVHDDVLLMPLWSFTAPRSAASGAPHTAAAVVRWGRQSADALWHPPLPFFAVISTPPLNSMTHLLNNSVLDVVVTYELLQSKNSTDGKQDPIVTKLFSKPVTTCC
jgi:hypothetical protein